MVKLSEQFHHHGLRPRLQGTGYGLQPAGKSVSSWKSVDCFLAPAARPPLSSVPSVVRDRVLFIAHCSLAIERSADNGIRIEVTTIAGSNAPVATYYLVDGNNPTGYAQVIEQSATPGTPAITYIWGETLIEQDNVAGTANAGTYYLIADAHGSTRMVVNSTGGVVQTYNYDSSGNALGFNASTAITQYLYNQQFFDIVSGQYYMRARNYEPATGTFTQQDTISIAPGDLANANLFLFAGADPINMFDPTGRFLDIQGYEAHDVISGRYEEQHPENDVEYGQLLQQLGIKPDILDYTADTFYEIKPLSLSGIASGIVQMDAYKFALTPGGFSPGTWAKIPQDINIGTLSAAFFNFGGILFYTDAVSNLKQLAAEATFAGLREAILANPALINSALDILGDRIPGLVARGVVASGEGATIEEIGVDIAAVEIESI